jgi:hypothetical protein
VSEIDYSDPEVRRILASYEDVTAQFKHGAAEIDLEYQAKAKEIQENAAKLAEQNREFYAQLERAEQTPETPETPSPWTAPRPKETVMSFGEFDDEEQASTWANPTPPMGFLPAPPIPQPEPDPEPLRAPPPPQPMMSFGEFDDDEEPVRKQPQPPAQKEGRRRLRADDDEDLSGQSWLS